MMRNSEATVDILQQIKASGVRIVMDDFGTKYSSLACLQRSPFDKVKSTGRLCATSGRPPISLSSGR